MSIKPMDTLSEKNGHTNKKYGSTSYRKPLSKNKTNSNKKYGFTNKLNVYTKLIIVTF